MHHARQFSDAQTKTNCRGGSAYPPVAQANRIPAFGVRTNTSFSVPSSPTWERHVFNKKNGCYICAFQLLCVSLPRRSIQWRLHRGKLQASFRLRICKIHCNRSKSESCSPCCVYIRFLRQRRQLTYIPAGVSCVFILILRVLQNLQTENVSEGSHSLYLLKR